MIWALAGLGAGGPYSTYNAEYTPAQKDAPVVIVEEQAGFPWALAGLVAIGLGVAYASYKKDEFEPNKSRARRKTRYSYDEKGWRRGTKRATINISFYNKSSPRAPLRSVSKATASRVGRELRKAGIRPGKIRSYPLDGNKEWFMKVSAPTGKIDAFRSLASQSGYEFYIT